MYVVLCEYCSIGNLDTFLIDIIWSPLELVTWLWLVKNTSSAKISGLWFDNTAASTSMMPPTIQNVVTSFEIAILRFYEISIWFDSFMSICTTKEGDGTMKDMKFGQSFITVTCQIGKETPSSSLRFVFQSF